MAMVNELYLAILPLIHISMNQSLGYGLTEQTLTLFADKKFATAFFPTEVDSYISVFKDKEKYLTGGHVLKYECYPEPTADGRVIVRVLQYVTH
jgi:hypothetical protein